VTRVAKNKDTKKQKKQKQNKGETPDVSAEG